MRKCFLFLMCSFGLVSQAQVTQLLEGFTEGKVQVEGDLPFRSIVCSYSNSERKGKQTSANMFNCLPILYNIK